MPVNCGQVRRQIGYNGLISYSKSEFKAQTNTYMVDIYKPNTIARRDDDHS